MKISANLAVWRRCLWVALLCLTAWNLAAAPARTVKVGVFPHAPAIFWDEKEQAAKGFYADMLREVAAQEGWELQFVPGTWSEGLERVRRNEVDLVTSVAYTTERDQFLDYGKVPSFTVWSLLYAKKGSGLKSILEVRDRRIGVMKGDINGLNFRDLCGRFNIPCQFVEYGSFVNVLEAIARHEVDGGVTSSTFGYFREADFEVERTPVVFNPFELFFAVAEGRNADLIRALDAYLKAGRADRNSGYQRSLDRWLNPQSRAGLPPWVFKVGVGILGLLLLTSIGVILFRRQVHVATRKIRTLNQELELELKERRRKEDLILNVASGVSSSVGSTFFHDLVHFLARATHADIAFIGEQHLKGNEHLIQLLALSVDGEPAETFEYTQAGTPCEKVIQGEFCVFSEGVQARFPEDALLQKLDVQSYVGAPLRDAEGRTVGLLGLMNRSLLADSTEVASLLKIFSARAAAELERQAADRERLLLERQVQHSQKLESLGVLAGGIAHDFNNLLTAMLGHLNVAQVKLPPESPAQPHLDSLEQIIHRTSDLTRQMLAYSGKGRFVVKAHDLSRVIREMAHLLEVSIPKKIALRLNLAESLPGVMADAAQIQQVVMNLVTNAADAIGEGEGTIRLLTSVLHLNRAYLDQVFHGQDLEEGDYVLLEVGDTGCGMSAEVQSRIFDPFFTTKVTGRGLGLSATLGILRGHKAGMKLYSELGRGTTFKLFFPASGETQPITLDAPAQAMKPLRARVLVVDDEAMIRDAVGAQLEALGLTVHFAADGREALDFFLEHPQDVDVVIMDLTMPRMDGREAFLALRKLRSNLPVILSSGYNEQESVQEFMGRGLSGFLQKPYTLGALEKMLRGILTEREKGYSG